jgi:predicted peroxiredoxin
VVIETLSRGATARSPRAADQPRDGGARDTDEGQDREQEKSGGDDLAHAAILTGGPPRVVDVTRRLVVKATCGAEDPERLSQALTVAATAVASGVDVSLWLTGDATWLGVEGRVPDLGLEHAAALPDLVAAVVAGGLVTVCTQCAARRGIEPADLTDGVRIAGAATFLDEVLGDDAQALVY